jgi:hypothetical protein
VKEVNDLMRKTALVLLLALVAIYGASCVVSRVFADGNATSTTVITSSAQVDTGFLIEMGLVFGGIGTLAFVVAELVGMYVTKSTQNSIVQTTGTAINAIVSMTGVGVTASHAAAVTEIAGVPTQIVTPGTTQATPAKP